MIAPSGYQKFSRISEKALYTTQNYIYEYEPSNIISVYNSTKWQWRRVYEWYDYINDPIENIKGHIIT